MYFSNQTFIAKNVKKFISAIDLYIYMYFFYRIQLKLTLKVLTLYK